MDIAAQLGVAQNLSMVRVTNRNGFVMSDRFDGVFFAFRPNKPETITHQAAMHFFGWPGEPQEMKVHTMKRFGWNRPDYTGMDKNKSIDEMTLDGKTLADRYWDNLKFEEVKYAIVEDQGLPESEPDDVKVAAPASVPESTDFTHGGGGRKRTRRLDI